MINSLITRFSRSRLSLPVRKMLRKARETYYNSEVLGRLERKTKPVPIKISDAEPRRINILIPEIDFTSFFGGYIAKFNLAKRLTEHGHQVRIVMIDQCEENPDTWDACIAQYEGLEDFQSRVEICAHFDRSRTLLVNPDDVIIATTWWSAYVAEAMRIELGQDRFLYLIQEYEPFTFPMGSWYAMADASYSFPHHAMFSSGLLEEFFRNSRFGVFAESRSDNPAAQPSAGTKIASDAVSSSLYFENAIVRYTEDDMAAVRQRHRPPQRLLFYARPEPHASRNMFEIGFLALRRAVQNGAFPADKWEIHGIGTSHGDIELGSGQTLRMLGKFGLEDYRATLLQYDVGLGLMYTPHPSLLPLEMAAAGMQVVTCECMNKTQETLTEISANMIAAQPTVAGVCAALVSAAQRSQNVQLRTNEDRINWSNSWDDCFDEKTIERIESWIV